MSTFAYTDYTITQEGINLSSETSIKISRSENKFTRLLFDLEDRLKDTMRLYLAILNPKTGRYHCEPILKDKEGNYFLIVGTSITKYVGKVSVILIGVDPSYDVINEDITELDPTVRMYTSKEFRRINVIGSFIDPDTFEVSMPNIDIALDNFVVLHDNVISFADSVLSDKEKCDEILIACNEDKETCIQLEESCQELHTDSAQILETNTSIQAECENLLEQVQQATAECTQLRNQCNASQTTINNTLSSAERVLADCRTILSRMQNLQNDYNTYQTNLRTAYEDYMSRIRQGGG